MPLRLPRVHLLGSSLAAAALFASLAPAGLAQAPAAYTRSGQFVGQDAPSRPVAATLWLNLHNEAELDARIQALYTPGSPTYHQWLTMADLDRYAPTAEEVSAVKAELAAHHLTVDSVDPHRLFVRVSGATSDVEALLHTSLEVWNLRGEQVRAWSRTPALGGEAAGLLRAVSGVTGAGPRPFLRQRINLATGKPQAGHALGAAPQLAGAASGAYTPQQCFSAQQVVQLTGFVNSTTATYSGPGLTGCADGYYPQDLWSFYGLNNAYGAGLSGAGQTVVIVDAYGSPTIQQDLTKFSSYFSLPNTTISTVQEPRSFSTTNSGWAEETTLDVEWAHAIAPGANLLLIATPTSNDSDLQAAVMYAVENHLGNVISNSYGEPESETSATVIAAWNTINKMAAANGISVNYASGDDGDYEKADFSTKPDVSVPADSPYATAVGGTAIAVNPVDGSLLTTGWGNNIDALSYFGFLLNPPDSTLYGFNGGSGGGTSTSFAKPAYQGNLPGNGRQLPDVSALADPFTGAAVIQTVNKQYQITPIGGTSLATPIISAMWALVNQRFGATNGLGQAAPYVAQFAGTPQIVDVQAPPSGYGATGVITTASGSQSYDQAALSQPLQDSSAFINVLAVLSGDLYSVSFGTDSSLSVTPGYDNVTGYGTPNFSVLP